MGDPVTMAMIGAAIGGGTSAARGGNPLKGALLGAVGGGVLGAASSAVPAAMTAPGITAGGAPFAITGATKGASLSSAALPSTTVALPAQAGGIFSTPMQSMQLANTLPFANPTMPGIVSTNASTGFIPSMTAPTTLMDRLSAAGKFAKENPFQMNLASNIAQQEMNRQPIQSMGLMRGNQIPQQQQQRSNFGVPQISLI